MPKQYISIYRCSERTLEEVATIDGQEILGYAKPAIWPDDTDPTHIVSQGTDEKVALAFKTRPLGSNTPQSWLMSLGLKPFDLVVPVESVAYEATSQEPEPEPITEPEQEEETTADE